jgi:DNA polymerase III subunit gamma/tau
MSSPVLARKYRPRVFEALVGQEHVVQALVNALKQQRLHHAYLFTGTRGVGKTTVSRILAKSLNCVGSDGHGGITASPCGVCPVCTEVDSGRFVDYVELDAASNRGVDEISQLLAQAVYKPVVGRFKVYMIDEVHMLSTTAFNAMLKTLEEPPEYLKFVLATTDPQKVPATVLSRCLQFNLRPMAAQTVQEHLVQVLAQEAVPAEPAALRLLARAARGSMRDALSLADQAIAYGAGSLTDQGVRRMLGAVDRSHAVRIVEAIASRDGAGIVAAVDALRTLGLSAAGTLEELCELMQRMAIVQAVPGAEDESEPDSGDVRRLAVALPADETQLLYSIALHGRGDLALSPDEYNGLVMVLLRMLAFAPGKADPKRGTESGETGGASTRSGVAPPASKQAGRDASTNSSAVTSRVPVREAGVSGGASWTEREADRAAPPGLGFEPTRQGDRWQALVRRMTEAGTIGALTRELAMQAECIAIDEEATPARWRLRVERETLRAPAQVEKLQSALTELLQTTVRLEVESGGAEDSPARREQVERERAQREAEALIESDPMVRTLLSQYEGARIVPGSIRPVKSTGVAE